MKILGLPALLLFAFTVCLQVAGQGTAFTYQGTLNHGGTPANGSYDLQFSLYATNATGSPVAGPVTNRATSVSNGLFTTTVDFGPGVFTGRPLWLDLSVSPAGSNTFTELTPRQPIASIPYAVMAGSASNLLGTLSAAALPSVVVTNGETGVNFSGTFTGNAAGLTNVNAASLNGIGGADILQAVITNNSVIKPAFQASPYNVGFWPTFFQYGPIVTETNVYEEITNFYNYGVNQLFPGGFTIMLDDGVISTSLSPAGLLQINTNAFPHGYAGVVNCAHSHGMRIVQVFECSTNYAYHNGSLGLSLTNLYPDATNMASMGLDGFRIENMDLQDFDNFYAWWESASTNNYAWVGDHSPLFFPGPANLALMPPNSYILYEIGGSDFIPSFWDVFHGTNLLTSVDTFTGEGMNQCPGRSLIPMYVGNAHVSWPGGQNTFNLACMFGGPLFFQDDLTPVTDGGPGVTLNPDAILVDNDPLKFFPLIAANNYGNWDLLEKPMADGGCVLMLMSYNTNQNWTVTIPFRNLTGPLLINSNEPVAVEDLNWMCGTNVIPGQTGTNEASLSAQWTWATNSITLTSHYSMFTDTMYNTNQLVWPCLRLWKNPPIAAYSSLFSNSVASLAAYSSVLVTNWVTTNAFNGNGYYPVSISVTNTGLFDLHVTFLMSGSGSRDYPNAVCIITNAATVGEQWHGLANSYPTVSGNSGGGANTYTRVNSAQPLDSNLFQIQSYNYQLATNLTADMDCLLNITNASPSSPATFVVYTTDINNNTDTNTVAQWSSMTIVQIH